MEAELTIHNDCSLSNVGSDFQPVMEEAIGSYRRHLEELLVSIRLLGSVARGEAVFGVSDITFVATTARTPEIVHRNGLTADAIRMTRRNVCVSRVDMELVLAPFDY